MTKGNRASLVASRSFKSPGLGASRCARVGRWQRPLARRSPRARALPGGNPPPRTTRRPPPRAPPATPACAARGRRRGWRGAPAGLRAAPAAAPASLSTPRWAVAPGGRLQRLSPCQANTRRPIGKRQNRRSFQTERARDAHNQPERLAYFGVSIQLGWPPSLASIAFSPGPAHLAYDHACRTSSARP